MTIVEIDVDFCSRTFGVAPCTAALSSLTAKKCYNSWKTCVDRPNYQKSVLTLRFSFGSGNLQRGSTIFPCVESISDYSASVNIAGADERLSHLGERASVDISMSDFPYHDRLIDKYARERVTGAAQFGGAGYDPQSRGTFWKKFQARYPYVYGRPLRLIEGRIEGGYLDDTGNYVGWTFVEEYRKNYIVTEINGPGEDGSVTVSGSDIFDIASNEKALAPKPSEGFLLADIDTSVMSLTLTPPGVGNIDYPASGNAVIGSEMVSFTRVGDVVTLTARGIKKTKIASHSANDSFQQVLTITNMRVDDYYELLLGTYGKMPSAALPKLTKWKLEIDRWASGFLLNTDIVKPTRVSVLAGELASFGISVYPSADGSEILIKTSRPPDRDPVLPLTDETAIIRLSPDKREDGRISTIVAYVIQTDPTKSETDKENYDQIRVRIDEESEGPNEYGVSATREIFSRYFNTGSTSYASVALKRILNRFRDPPTVYEITLDRKDANIGLTDVIEVTTSMIQDEDGLDVPTLMQVVRKSGANRNGKFKILAQVYPYSGKYGFVTEDTRPVYGSSSAAQKKTGAYFVGPSGVFADGGEAYRFI